VLVDEILNSDGAWAWFEHRRNDSRGSGRARMNLVVDALSVAAEPEAGVSA